MVDNQDVLDHRFKLDNECVGGLVATTTTTDLPRGTGRERKVKGVLRVRGLHCWDRIARQRERDVRS